MKPSDFPLMPTSSEFLKSMAKEIIEELKHVYTESFEYEKGLSLEFLHFSTGSYSSIRFKLVLIPESPLRVSLEAEHGNFEDFSYIIEFETLDSNFDPKKAVDKIIEYLESQGINYYDTFLYREQHTLAMCLTMMFRYHGEELYKFKNYVIMEDCMFSLNLRRVPNSVLLSVKLEDHNNLEYKKDYVYDIQDDYVPVYDVFYDLKDFLITNKIGELKKDKVFSYHDHERILKEFIITRGFEYQDFLIPEEEIDNATYVIKGLDGKSYGLYFSCSEEGIVINGLEDLDVEIKLSNRPNLKGLPRKIKAELSRKEFLRMNPEEKYRIGLNKLVPAILGPGSTEKHTWASEEYLPTQKIAEDIADICKIIAESKVPAIETASPAYKQIFKDEIHRLRWMLTSLTPHQLDSYKNRLKDDPVSYNCEKCHDTTNINYIGSLQGKIGFTRCGHYPYRRPVCIKKTLAPFLRSL